MRSRRIRRASIGAFAVVVAWLALAGAFPVGAQSPLPPECTPGPCDTLLVTASPSPTSSLGPVVSPSPATAPLPSASPAASPSSSSAACPLPAPNPSATPLPAGATPPPHALCPAVPSGNPIDILAFLFNPIFQTMFLLLAVFYKATGDVGIAIILLTLLIKTILIPLFRAQIVSQRRMQMLQPEIKALQVKFKGNRSKISEETMRLYRERGVSVGSGCLPAFLQLFLLIPVYSVISQGLAAPDISSALQFLGQPLEPVLNIMCQAPGTLQPCIDPTIHWLGGLDAHFPEVLFTLPVIGFHVSGLALIASFLQLIQTRMMTPNTTDPQARAQQRIFLILPLFSIIYGSFLPAGLFLYWIVFTAYSIVQQYLIVGFGSLFPLFGWTPGFAKDHQPRFPIQPPTVKQGATSGDGRQTEEPSRSPSDRAAGTIKPARQRARTSRRGRRR